jgi:hypothetical protein
MAMTQKRLSGPAVVINSGTYGGSQYAVPVSTSTIVKQIVLTNITASAQTVTISVKPSGVALADTHQIFKDLSLTEKETTLLNMSLVLNASDELYMLCGTGSAVNATVSGIEIT